IVESVKGVKEGDFVIPVCYRFAGMGFPQEVWQQPGVFPIVGRSSEEAGGGLGGQADALHRVPHAEGVVHVRAWGATGCIVLEFLNSHDSFVELSKSRRFYCPLHHFRDHPSINAKPRCLLLHFSTLHSPGNSNRPTFLISTKISNLLLHTLLKLQFCRTPNGSRTSFKLISSRTSFKIRAAKLPVGVGGPKEEPKLPVSYLGFTRTAEIWNSRACMIGLIGTFIVEM
ncbi:hypothetical protein KI387_017357, partial [Taxus chinensis]